MVLVTGATGLVGSHLVLHLIEQDQDVFAMFRNEQGKERVRLLFEKYQKADLFHKIIWRQADILDVPSLESAFQEVEYVYHCAALISFDPKDEPQLRKINIEGTANIVNLSIDKKIKKLCYVSSIAALGDIKISNALIDEEGEWNAEAEHSDYAISKYGAEMEIWRGEQEGLKVVVVNPGVILGPLFWTEGSGEMYAKVKNGLLYYTKGINGFVAVSDVVKAVFLLMKSDISGQKFILVSENVIYKDLVFMIAEALNVKKPNINVGKFFVSMIWRADWFLTHFFGKKRELTKDLAHSLHATKMYSNENIKKALNFEYEGIRDYIYSSKT